MYREAEGSRTKAERWHTGGWRRSDLAAAATTTRRTESKIPNQRHGMCFYLASALCHMSISEVILRSDDGFIYLFIQKFECGFEIKHWFLYGKKNIFRVFDSYSKLLS
jgi:hypothetical protein